MRLDATSASCSKQDSNTVGPVQWLSDASPKDKPWDEHRAFAARTATAYRNGPDTFHKRGDRMAACAPILEFGEVVDPETGEAGFRLQQAYFCRIRFCPVCMWRRALQWTARMFQALPLIEAAYPKHRWLFVTLTVRNPSLAELRPTLKAMRYGWRKMTGYKDWPGVGAVRSLEVTKGQDDNPHPHFHALVLVPRSYFTGKKYLSQDKWVAMWKRAMQLDYDPSVNVKAIKAEDVDQLRGAILETLKYSVKPADLTNSDDWLYAMTDALHGVRSVEVFAGLKPMLKEVSEEGGEDDLIGESEDGAEHGDSILFNWFPSHDRYGRRPS